MKSIADRVVYPSVVRERAMARVVRHAPPSCPHDALPTPVKGPAPPTYAGSQSGAKIEMLRKGEDGWINQEGEAIQSIGGGNIANNIGQGLDGASLKEMFRYCCVNFRCSDLQATFCIRAKRHGVVDSCYTPWLV